MTSGSHSEDRPLDPKAVEKPEEEIEEAVAEIVVKMGLKKLPLLPARHSTHSMAKAAKRLSRTASTD